MNMNNVFKYKCVSNLQVKPGYTRKSPGIPEKYPGSTSMPRSPYTQGPCANCGAIRLLKYAHRTMCCRYKCQRAAAALRQARLAVRTTRRRTFIFKIEAVLGMSFCDPSSSLQRSGAISWLLPTRPFATSRAASSEWTGMTNRHAGPWVEHELRHCVALG